MIRPEDVFVCVMLHFNGNIFTVLDAFNFFHVSKGGAGYRRKLVPQPLLGSFTTQHLQVLENDPSHLFHVGKPFVRQADSALKEKVI